MASAPAPAPLPPIWRQRNFMLLWSGQVVSSLGGGMTAFALPLVVLALTGSPLIAGVASALGWLPYPLFGLPAGALMDRWNRKRVMIACDAIRALNIASLPLALAFGRLSVPQIYVNAFVDGSCFVLFNVAEVAALPRVVDRSQLASATAHNEVAYSLVGLVSPSIGGVLYKNVSAAFPFVFDAISYAASVVSLSFITVKFQTERAPKAGSLAAAIREGLAWLWARPLIRTMAFVTSGINLTTAGATLAVLVLARQRGADAQSVGFMFSLAAVGGLVGALIAGPLARRLSFAQGVLSSLWLSTALFPLLLVMPSALAIGAVLAVIALAEPLYNVVQLSYRLSLIPDHLQGRVNSVFRMIAFGCQPLGAALTGALLERFGVTVAFIVLGAAQLVLAIAATANRHIWHGPRAAA